VSIVFRGFLEGFENIFAFSERRSRFHGVDPRVKMMYIAASIVIAFLITDPLKLSVLILFNIVLAVFSKIPLDRFASAFKSLAIFTAIIYIINFVLRIVFEGPTIATMINTALFIANVALRMILVAVPLMIFTNTTTPREVLQGLVSLGFSYKYLYVIVLGMRFVPIVFREVLNIYDAQRSRGVEFERSGVIDRIKKLKTIVIPAFVCSMLRARDLLEALELKGYGYRNYRTFYKSLGISKLDLVFIVSILALYSTIAMV